MAWWWQDSDEAKRDHADVMNALAGISRQNKEIIGLLQKTRLSLVDQVKINQIYTTAAGTAAKLAAAQPKKEK